jgi:hypothetical protein
MPRSLIWINGPTIRIVHGLISKSVCNVLQKWETRMFVQKMLITAALLQLMIVPGMTQAIKPDSAHRYQGGPKTEEHVKNSRASIENNFLGSNLPRYDVHQYHGGPKGH